MIVISTARDSTFYQVSGILDDEKALTSKGSNGEAPQNVSSLLLMDRFPFYQEPIDLYNDKKLDVLEESRIKAYWHRIYQKKKDVSTMREQLEKMPVSNELPGFKPFSPGTWGGLFVEYIECAEKLDIGPMLEGLPDSLCPYRHWGYMLEGALHIKYKDGTEEVIEGGDAFYVPKGHAGWFEAGSKMVLSSPEAESKQLAEHVPKRVQG